MANPTRAQIESVVALPTYSVEVDTGSGYVVVTGAEVQSINTKVQTTNNVDNAFAFGTIATAETTVQITDAYVLAN